MLIIVSSKERCKPSRGTSCLNGRFLTQDYDASVRSLPSLIPHTTVGPAYVAADALRVCPMASGFADHVLHGM
jgi:hypothetical protein